MARIPQWSNENMQHHKTSAGQLHFLHSSRILHLTVLYTTSVTHGGGSSDFAGESRVPFWFSNSPHLSFSREKLAYIASPSNDVYPVIHRESCEVIYICIYNHRHQRQKPDGQINKYVQSHKCQPYVYSFLACRSAFLVIRRKSSKKKKQRK